MRRLFLCLAVLMAGIATCAQNTAENGAKIPRQLSVKGTVKDESGVAVSGAIVKVSVQEAVLGYSMADESGHYEIHFMTDAKRVTVSAECLGYESVTVTRPSSSTTGCNLTMKEKATALKEVVVRAPAIHQRGDTLSYSLSAYATRGDYTLKDAIKKLPGIDVTEAGAIKYLGKDISKFYIEGLDLLGGKYNIATTNIPASYVNQVQVLSNHQEAKVDKDVFSDDVAINIKLSDKAKLKPTGTYEAAAGYGDDWLYSLSGAGMLFTPKTQAIATVKTGNIKSFAADGGKTLTGTSEPESKASELLGNLSASEAPLKPERFLSPSDILLTLNAIRKTGRNSTIKANAGYSTSKSDYEYSQTSIYYDGSGNMQVNRSVSPESTLRKPWLSMTFQNNSPKCYINEDFSLKTTSRESTVPTGQNGNMLVQGQSIRDIDLKNDFTARWRTSKLRWNVYSVLEYSEAPTASLEISSDENEGIFQNAQSKGFRTENSLSTVFESGSNRLYVPLMLNYSSDNITTSLDDNLSAGQNDVTSSQLKLAIAPQYEYTHPRRKFVFRAELPIRLDNISSRQEGKDYFSNFGNVQNLKNSLCPTAPNEQCRVVSSVGGHFDRLSDRSLGFMCIKLAEASRQRSDLYFSVCPDLYFNWNVSPRSVLRATASYSRTFGDALDFLTAPVRLDETTVRVSSGILFDTKTLSANLHYDFKVPLEQWFINADLAYVRNWNNQIVSQDITEDIIMTGTLARPNVSDNIVSQLGVAKQISSIRTKISLSGSLLCSNQSTIQSGKLSDVSWQSAAISPSLYSNPLDWLELDYSGELTRTSAGYDSVRKHYLSQSHDIALKLLPGDTFHFTAGTEISRHQITDDLTKTMALLDCGLSFRHRSLQLSLDLRNLLNQKSYSYTIYSTVNTFTYDYHLRGRELILSLRFTL